MSMHACVVRQRHTCRTLPATLAWSCCSSRTRVQYWRLGSASQRAPVANLRARNREKKQFAEATTNMFCLGQQAALARPKCSLLAGEARK